MYDELVKALRYCRASTCCQFCPSDRKDIVWTVDECIDKLHNDAADAIEQMQTDIDKKNRIIKVLAKKVGQLINQTIQDKEKQDDAK